jgi:hypothetical protein
MARRKALTAQPLGTVVIRDPRLGIDRRLDITTLELRHGRLYVEATGEITAAGTIQEDDVFTIHDPDGRTVMRTWLDTSGVTYDVEDGERFTLMLPISLGGARPLVTGDSTLDIDL